MYVAMNRFRINLGHEDAFEARWRTRDRHLEGVSGFRGFLLLRGPPGEDGTEFISHSSWESEADFVAWTEGAAFRAGHARAQPPAGMHAGAPRFEGFQVVLDH